MATGLMAAGAKQPSGKWYNEYQTTTDQNRKQQLFNTYGKRYGWGAPAAATPGAAAPGGAATGPNYRTPQISAPDKSNSNVNQAIPGVNAQLNANTAAGDQSFGYNRPNESYNMAPGISASSNWSIDPTTGQATNTQSLDPWQQTQYGQEQWMNMERNKQYGDMWGKQWAPTLGKAFDYSGQPAVTGSGDFSADRQRVEDQLYNSAKGRLDTEWSQRQQQVEQNLADKGYTPGSEAYNAEMRAFNDGRNKAYEDARTNAVGAGGAEQSRLFGLNLTARQQGISEADALRNRPFEEMRALRETPGSTVVKPTFTPMNPINVATPDVLGASVGFGQQQTAKDVANIQANAAKAAGGGGEGEKPPLDLDAPVGGRPAPTNALMAKPAARRSAKKRGLMAIGG